MLLLHQAGSVKIGEVVRYTVTYTPAHDRILPSPPHLHLKIKNTSAIALRAAFVHGPYTLYAAAYPANFHPNQKFENPRRDGVPEFEPNLKAGGSFLTQLAVPEDVRKTAGTADRHGRSPGREGEEVKSVTWIIEVTSQVIFSNSAAVHYEILLARDEKSLALGFASRLTGSTAPTPGQVSDHQQSQGAKEGRHPAQPKGIYSKAIKLRVDDTASLWNTPKMPEWDDAEKEMGEEKNKDAPVDKATQGKDDASVDKAVGKEDAKPEAHRQKRQKKVHLVVLTHGLHSNLGADMLYLKESIDAAAKQAKIDARARKAKGGEERGRKTSSRGQGREETNEGERGNEETKPPGEQHEELEDTGDEDEDEDQEEVIVRGFSGNAVRTERGIKYLGKRLAKYVLAMTYPDQPYKPITKKSASTALSHALRPEPKDDNDTPTHKGSTIVKEPYQDKKLAYKITSISFIAHSLGGLIQTYAVAYIQKHSPEFFNFIEPINFIALASPFLGLSNENPLYVKFALDFGLVGRTGQDLGLTWRAPTIARSGWGAIVGGIGESAHKRIDGESAPESKPLLRILPTGPAHTVLKKFRNRTVYSNVVNDGIVPLRTSCLLFLDWQGLGRVEKARRENGLVGTMAGWGWAEITGANSSSPSRRAFSESTSDAEDAGDNTPTREGHGDDVPQPPPYATHDDDTQSLKSVTRDRALSRGVNVETPNATSVTTNNDGPLASLFKLFQPNQSPKAHNHEPRHTKIYKRSQTLKITDSSESSTPTINKQPSSPKEEGGKATTGDAEHEDPERLSAPPKTTFFESAGDLLKPPLPSVDFLIDPSSRSRTIFHDRVYHPEDIPPPPLKKQPTSSLALRKRSNSGISSGGSASSVTPGINKGDSSLSARDYDDTRHTNPDKDPRDVIDGSAMKVEEKIARAYHRDLSWRKVLVRLEPDAHNNMIVRRMFANAYGWPVIKHLCDTHFADSPEANTRDEDESNAERAKDENEGPSAGGDETKFDKSDWPRKLSKEDRTDSEKREATDHVPALNTPNPSSLGKALAAAERGEGRPRYERAESDAGWSERDWMDSADDSDDGIDERNPHGRSASTSEVKKGGWNWTEAIAGKGATSPRGTEKGELDKFLGKRSPDEIDKQLESDATAAGMGIGLGQLGPDGEGGSADRVESSK